MKTIWMTTFYGQIKSKKNSKQIGYNKRTGKPFVRQSDAAKAQEIEMIEAFRDDMIAQNLDPKRLLGKKLTVEIDIWNKDLKNHDLDNQLATIMDALTKAEFIPGDDQKVVVRETIAYKGVDREDPRAEITITAS